MSITYGGRTQPIPGQVLYAITHGATRLASLFDAGVLTSPPHLLLPRLSHSRSIETRPCRLPTTRSHAAGPLLHAENDRSWSPQKP
jgi:hypothetical protein